MRRNEHELTDQERVEALIRSCQVCRPGVVDGDRPYIVPLNFGDARELTDPEEKRRDLTCMNEITVSPVTTPYGYEEHYLLVDGISVAELTDRFVRENGDNDLKRFRSLNGLCPAWGPGMQNRGEIRFIHQLLWQEEPVNLPILVCEDDLDLSCIVIVAAVRKQGGAVFWDRIGYVDHSEWDPGREMVSGILCLEAYTEDDWARYGDNIALEQVRSRDWRLWISEHWDEELYRRRMNYTLPYFQDERHIRWLKDTEYAFDRTAYENCIRFYEEELRRAVKFPFCP